MNDYVRVRLFFDDFEVEPSWLCVNIKTCKTIADMEEKICSKFDLSTCVKLMLTDCRVPHWESINVLRDGDIIHVTKGSTVSSQEQKQKKVLRKMLSVESSCSVLVSKDKGEDMNCADETEENRNMLEIKGMKCKEMGEKTKLNPKAIDSSNKCIVNNMRERKKRKRKRRKSDMHDPSQCYESPNHEQDSFNKYTKNLSDFEIQRNNHVTFDEEEMSNDEDYIQRRQHHVAAESLHHGNISVQTEEEILPSGVAVYTRQKKRNLSLHVENEKTQLNKADSAIEESTHGRTAACDYSHLPEFEGLPCPGDKIAYRTLELSERRAPALSGFKVALVKSFEPISTSVELQLLSHITKNGCETTNCIEKDTTDSDDKVTLEWSTLLQVKLLA